MTRNFIIGLVVSILAGITAAQADPAAPDGRTGGGLPPDQTHETRISGKIGIAGALGLCVLGVLAWRGFKGKRESEMLLQRKQTELCKQHAALKHLNSEKAELLYEKDWLLREVNHRVKNNLQVIMSLLSTQSAFLKNKAALGAISASRDRVQAISLIHQKLYSESGVARIRTGPYVHDLIEYLADTRGTNQKKIRFTSEVENIELELSQAMPLGLILNEAISNAINYAFPESGGEVRIVLETGPEDSALLTIADSGTGLPLGFDHLSEDTLGIAIMKSLSRQLGGEFSLVNKGGVTINVRFRVEKIIQCLSLGKLLHDTQSA